jgi:hypothetical protein
MRALDFLIVRPPLRRAREYPIDHESAVAIAQRRTEKLVECRPDEACGDEGDATMAGMGEGEMDARASDRGLPAEPVAARGGHAQSSAAAIPRRTFYLLRHGQTKWDLERRFQGHAKRPRPHYTAASA